MSTPSQFVVANLNMKLMPMDRGEAFEDPLDEELKNAGLGEVCGGGTGLTDSGEVSSCDVEIQLSSIGADVEAKVIELLENLGAAKGSTLRYSDGREVAFGKSEGLAVYLNGSDLPAEVYQTSDVNFVYEQLNELVDGIGMIFSYWEGESETALYLYGISFTEMKERITEFVNSYPLCQQCRIVQIA
jgi:hypothetical protein